MNSIFDLSSYHLYGQVGKEVLSWQDYIKGKADMMKMSTISEVRSRAGLGCPPEKFMTMTASPTTKE